MYLINPPNPTDFKTVNMIVIDHAGNNSGVSNFNNNKKLLSTDAMVPVNE